jgi:beta-lactam-binding protein with PASTA domain/serine/threonine protein kinase
MDTKVADMLIGALVDGRYRVRGLVARGGMATVYAAVDERLERTVALKVIHPGQADDPRFVDRFTREAKTIARLTHPNVVAVYDQGNYEGLPYLVMEYVRGRTLRDMLTDLRRLEPVEALSILEQMLAAIAAAHRAGLVHRDVKPENVLIAEAPGTNSLMDAVVKVADFGLARAVEASAEDGDGQLLATVAYVAPELVTDGWADPRTDVYSTGIVLFEMLTGRVPYDGGKPLDIAWRHVDEDVPRPSKYVPEIPGHLDDLVVRATRRIPDERPTDAGAMLAEVQTVRDMVETEASLRGKTVAAPTIAVDTIRPVAGDERPSWARLPGRDEDQRTRRSASGTSYEARGVRSAGVRPSPRAAAGARIARSRGDAAMSWFRGVMSRPNGRRTFYVVLSVLALVVVLTGWWFGSGRYTTAPALNGLTKTQAVAAAQKAGFTVKISSSGVFEEKIPKDTVVGQDPPGHGRIVRGGTITLTLSKGPERYAVPDETGKQYDAAVADIGALNLIATRKDVYSDTVPAGIVISVSPKPTTLLQRGASVTLTVSKGKAPISVPNVIGQDFNSAAAQLSGLGLVVAQTQKQSDKPAGTVIAQNPQGGSGVEKNAQVTLTVSSGPPQVQVPNVSNQNLTFDQAAQALQQQGLVADRVNEGNGPVFNQNPPAGTTVPQGTHVQLWVYP